MAKSPSSTRKLSKKRIAFLPRQHGAYAILLIPLTAGLVKAPHFTWGQAALAIAWISSYLSFYQLSLFLKTKKARRRKHLIPLLSCLGSTFLFSLPVFWERGCDLWAWIALLIVPVGAACWCLKIKQERSVLSGALTTFISCAVALVAAYSSPALWLADSPHFTALIWGAFCYFFGTVLHVKSLIRERGKAKAGYRSLAWHIFSLLSIVILTYLQLLKIFWIFLALLWLVRVIATLIWDRNHMRRIPAPLLGIMEVICSCLLLVALLL